jgi:hypothetical protein
LFRTDVDNSQRYHDFHRVQFDNNFGFVTASTQVAGLNKLSAGYATRFGGEDGDSVYLGTWFHGNFFRQEQGNNARSVRTTIVGTDVINDQTQNQILTTTDYSDNAFIHATNQVDVLLGVAGMGIKVGFFQSWASDKNPASPSRNLIETDFTDGRVRHQNEVVEYTRQQGIFIPSIGWGMIIGSLRPYVNMGLHIYSDKQIDNFRPSYVAVNGEKVGFNNITFGAGHNRGWLAPDINIGSNMVLDGGVTVGIDYRLNFRIYNNDYDVAGFSGTANGPVSWTSGSSNIINGWNYTQETREAVLAFADTSRMAHTINPLFQVIRDPAENLRLGFLMRAPVTITTETQNNYSETRNLTLFRADHNEYLPNARTEIVTRTNSGETQTTTVDIFPRLSVGATYQLVPNRFTVNAGITAHPVRYTYSSIVRAPNGVTSTTTTVVRDTNGDITSENVTINTNTIAQDELDFGPRWQSFSGTAFGGFEFRFSQQASLDLFASSSFFTVNAANLNVLLTFKF